LQGPFGIEQNSPRLFAQPEVIINKPITPPRICQYRMAEISWVALSGSRDRPQSHRHARCINAEDQPLSNGYAVFAGGTIDKV
jgi:hypothetical protein